MHPILDAAALELYDHLLLQLPEADVEEIEAPLPVMGGLPAPFEIPDLATYLTQLFELARTRSLKINDYVTLQCAALPQISFQPQGPDQIRVTFDPAPQIQLGVRLFRTGITLSGATLHPAKMELHLGGSPDLTVSA